MSDQNQPQDPQGNGPNPWVKSLMVWGGVFLALLVVVSVFGNSGQPAGEAIGYSDFRDRVAEGSKGVLNSLVDGHASTTTMS